MEKFMHNQMNVIEPQSRMYTQSSEVQEAQSDSHKGLQQNTNQEFKQQRL